MIKKYYKKMGINVTQRKTVIIADVIGYEMIIQNEDQSLCLQCDQTDNETSQLMGSKEKPHSKRPAVQSVSINFLLQSIATVGDGSTELVQSCKRREQYKLQVRNAYKKNEKACAMKFGLHT